MTECTLCSCAEFNSIKGGSFCGTCKHHVLKHTGNSRGHSSHAVDNIVTQSPGPAGDNRYLRILTNTVYSYRNKRHISSARSPVPYVQGTRVKYYDISCDLVNGELEYWYCVENDKSPNARWICGRDQSWLKNDHITVESDEPTLPSPPARPVRNDRQDPTKNTELLRKAQILNSELMEVLGTIEETEVVVDDKPQSLFSNFLSGIFSCVSDATGQRDNNNMTQHPVTFEDDGEDEADSFNSIVPLDPSISSFDELDNPYAPSAKQASKHSIGNNPSSASSSRGSDINNKATNSAYSARQAAVPPAASHNAVLKSNSRSSELDAPVSSPIAQTTRSVPQPVRPPSSITGSPEAAASISATAAIGAMKVSSVNNSSGPGVVKSNSGPSYEEAWSILTNPKAIKSGEDVKVKFDALIDDLGVEKAEDLKLITEASVSGITKCMKEVFGGKFADAWRAGR
jgi:hypothetical protein